MECGQLRASLASSLTADAIPVPIEVSPVARVANPHGSRTSVSGVGAVVVVHARRRRLLGLRHGLDRRAGRDSGNLPLRGTNGTLLVAAGGEAALVLRDLGSAPEGKLYEVWVSADGDVMLPAGTFDASTGVGATVVSLSRPVPQNGLVAVTVEDEPVDTPTGDPIITARTA